MQRREQFEKDLTRLSDSILLMASRVEEQLSLALAAYERLDASIGNVVVELDQQVNKLRYDIEEQCILLIALQQPAARDMRLIISALNMIVDLERIGDQAKGVVKALHHLHKRPVDAPPLAIKKMGVIVLDMLHKAKEAYASRNVELAQTIGEQDDEVDSLYAQAFTTVMYRMADATTPEEIEDWYEVLRVAREFERAGDLVTNVAEQVIYLVTGNLLEINVDRPGEVG
jgi:phosphate transport system protein